ncbi:MAG: hypothetical protein LBU53_00160, partial [Zoogloeaceae bacterium]|nr:hypothetical protein [Zoogloeaceae bacterium]
MEVIVTGICIVVLVWLILPIVALARQSALSRRCALLQKQLKELVECFESVSKRLERLEAARVVAPPAPPAPVVSVAPAAAVAARVEMETPIPKPATLIIEPPTATPATTANAPEAALELDDLAEVVKSMYRAAAETSATAP